VLDYREAEGVAHSLRLQLQSVELSRSDELDRALSTVAAGRAEALIVPAVNPVAFANRGEIARFAQRARLPSIFGTRDYVEAGGLIAYGPSIVEPTACCQATGLMMTETLC